ncbi:SdiA-regulated domain-containing protein [Echinicola jeungdonensis]|uniref:SdiA-regulated domain-containing protein n=1 Tax=Echinicola jeungdonensis TaxID=709343 RepID=A0ABV5J4P0_9BACT|nr:SdiA-regulated domain-containing protein [Echinicola jeungdonensis]MDN3668870.1 SdiA-regulated domain-containing protein [Echinicola jeungdonensis]
MKRLIFICLLIFILTNSCGLRENRFPGPYVSPENYDLDQPEKMILPMALDEISGLTIGPENRIWAIQDEAAIVYELNWPDNRVVRRSKYAKNMDVEDILFVEKGLFALKSNGDIYEIMDIFSKEVDAKKHDFPFNGKRDMEALGYYDDDRLILFCKKCNLDKDKNVASAFFFDLNSNQFSNAKDFKLTEKKIRELLNEERHYKLTVKPSAVAFNPVDRKYYVLSSVGKWLLVMDKFGDYEEVFRLNPRLFKQAEGICFNQMGDMFISNEARDGNANILKFNYKKNQQ